MSIAWIIVLLSLGFGAGAEAHLQSPVARPQAENDEGVLLLRHEAYELRRFAPASERVGIEVVGRGKFKINLKYPWRLVGAKNQFDRSKFEQTEQRSYIEVSIDELPAELRFGMCDEHGCLMERAKLEP